MKTDIQIRRHVMLRIYAVYALRAVLKPAPRAAVFITLMLSLFASVSVVDVVANAINAAPTPEALLVFLLAAVQNTSPVVYALAAALGVWVAWFAVDRAQAPANAPVVAPI